MPERIPQSVTLRVPLEAYLSSDHVSAATGKTIAVTISKNGAAYANPSAGATNATEIGSGSYYVDLSTTDTGTVGPLFVLGTASGVDAVKAIYDVAVGSVAQTGDSYARIGATGSGLISLAPAATALSTTQWTDGRAAKLDNLDAAISAVSTYAGGDTSGTTTLLSRLSSGRASNLDFIDASILSRMATFTYTTPPTAAAIAALVAAGAVASVVGTVGSVAAAVTIDMTQAVPLSNTAETVGDCLHAARVQGFGSWVLDGTVLTLKNANGTTAKTLNLDSATAPTSRS